MDFAGILKKGFPIPRTTPLKRLLILSAVGAVACGGGDNGPTPLGPPASMAIVGGTAAAPANTDLGGLTLVVRDANNNALPNKTVTFTVLAGGGSVQTTSATTGENGTLTVPTWRLGKLDVPQTLRAQVDGIQFDIGATVQTQYNVLVRFYGTPPSTAHQAMFTNAAARIRAVITGELANVSTGANFDISSCTPGQSTTISETIDDVVIYVQVTNIDGSGNILASAGPCFVRNGKNASGQGGADSLTTVIGTMRFDQSDIGNLREETILHEMLHVIGIGSMWPDPHPDGWGLIENVGQPAPRYKGSQGVQGCQELGFPVTCATRVPVEDTLGAGTRDVHWEENIFDTELMTGFVENSASPMPFSIMTVRALRDIGYQVNLANVDPYTKPIGVGNMVAPGASAERRPWEMVSPVPIRTIDPQGRVGRELRRRP